MKRNQYLFVLLVSIVICSGCESGALTDLTTGPTAPKNGNHYTTADAEECEDFSANSYPESPTSVYGRYILTNFGHGSSELGVNLNRTITSSDEIEAGYGGQGVVEFPMDVMLTSSNWIYEPPHYEANGWFDIIVRRNGNTVLSKTIPWDGNSYTGGITVRGGDVINFTVAYNYALCSASSGNLSIQFQP